MIKFAAIVHGKIVHDFL